MSQLYLKNSPNSIIWKQKNNEIIVHFYQIAKKGLNKDFEELIHELIVKKVKFTLKISETDIVLFLYTIRGEKHNFKKERLSFLDNLALKSNLKNCFYSNIRKLKDEKELVKIILDDKEIYLLAYIVNSTRRINEQTKREFTKFLQFLLETNMFNVTLSNLPQKNSTNEQNNRWGITIEVNSIKAQPLSKKNEGLKQLIKTKNYNLDITISKVSKRDIERNIGNFYLNIPWVTHDGEITEIINFQQILFNKKKEIIPHTEKKQLKKEQKISESKKPYPSVRELEKQRTKSVELNIHQSSNELVPKNQPSFNTKSKPSKDIPMSMNIDKRLDIDKIKTIMINAFKDLGYKTSMIFNNKFDLVLRKESSYIFIIISSEPFTKEKAYEIIDTLSNLAGLREDFLCFTITDIVEKTANSLLNEYNIIQLPILELLNQDKLKSLIYEEVSNKYTNLSVI